MSTGHASVSLAASSGSAAACSSIWTAMKMPSSLIRLSRPLSRGRLLRELGFDHLGDVLDALGDRDPRLGQAGDLLRGGVLLAFDDRAGVAEGHPRHLVHEAPRHEGDDRQ